MMTDKDLPEFQAALQICMGVWEELCGKQNKVQTAPDVTCKAVVSFPGKQQCKERGEGSSSGTKTEAFLLPEELFEKIVCMMPFPHILKARVLNQSWKLKISVNREVSREAEVFRNQVKAISSKWKHYCPTILNLETGWLVGYDRQCNQWQCIPLTFYGKCFGRTFFKTQYSTPKLKGSGSLMCGVWQSMVVNEIYVPFLSYDVFVTNIVIGSWTYLPTLRATGNLVDIHLLTVGADAYEVIVITETRNFSHIYFHLYDSRIRRSWITSRPLQYMGVSGFFSSALLRGHLYVMGLSGCHIDIGSYCHDKEILKFLPEMVESPGQFYDRNHRLSDPVQTGALIICQNQVLVVLTGPTQLPPKFLVYILNQVTLDMTAVAQGPPWWIADSCRLLASDNERIYFGNPGDAGTSMVQLNLNTNKWSCLRPPPPHCAGLWAAFSLEPGIHPFLPV